LTSLLQGLVRPVLATKEKPIHKSAVRGNYQGVIWFLVRIAAVFQLDTALVMARLNAEMPVAAANQSIGAGVQEASDHVPKTRVVPGWGGLGGSGCYVFELRG
jgi:hypothetical protein